jgi:hypothetical protein
LLSLLSELGADALEGIANWGVGRRYLLVAMIDLKAAGVRLGLDQLVHSRSGVNGDGEVNVSWRPADDKNQRKQQ